MSVRVSPPASGIQGLIEDEATWSRGPKPKISDADRASSEAQTDSGEELALDADAQSEPILFGVADELIYGSSGAEVLPGHDGNDTIYAQGGDDDVFGGTGNDTLYGEGGADFIDGGTDDDVIYGGDDDDLIYNGAGSDVVYGGDGDDHLVGDYNSVTLGPGNVLITHADVLYGGAGNDTFTRGGGGTFEDAYYGGSGSDTIEYIGSLSSDIHWDLQGGGLFTFGNHVEVWDSFENYVNLTINSNEQVTGTDTSNYIETGNGLNSISGLGGDDTIVSGGGADTVDAGAGNDLVRAGGGGDWVDGGSGNDSIEAGGGNDLIFGGAGADNVNGGIGIDTFSYAGSAAGIFIQLGGAPGNGGDATGDVLIGIENVIGSEFNDVIFGDSAVNTLFGGAGTDVLQGGAGADVLYGGDGLDWAGYFGANSDLVIDLETPGNSSALFAEDTLFEIEVIGGASSFSTTFIGDAVANIFVGGNVADDVFGNGGNDLLQGGGGADTVDGGAGGDAIMGNKGDDLLIGGGQCRRLLLPGRRRQ